MVKIELDKTSVREMNATLVKLSKLTGKGVDEGIREIGKSCAKRLASTVQPYGLSPAKGKSFEKSIRLQVQRAWVGVNLGAFPATTDMRQAHYSARNSRGVVPERQFRKEKNNKWKHLISQRSKDEYARTVSKKAGRAKAAWIEAGNKLGVGIISKIPNWISRHLGSGYGDCRITGRELKTAIALENKTPYLRSIQKDSAVATALAQGYHLGFKRLEYLVNAEMKKLSKATK